MHALYMASIMDQVTGAQRLTQRPQANLVAYKQLTGRKGISNVPTGHTSGGMQQIIRQRHTH